jgi:hypothetical protein
MLAKRGRFDGLVVAESPAYRAISGDNVSIWSKRIRAKGRRLLRFEGEQILPGDVLALERSGGLLVVGMTPPAAAEARAPLQGCRQRPEISRALPPLGARGDRRRQMETGEQVDADAGAYPDADHRPRALRLPPL